MLVAGLDPGLVNCGVVVASVDTATGRLTVLRWGLVDLSSEAGCLHQRVSIRVCSLAHTTLADRVRHLAQEYDFESCDAIVCESQPPQSAGYCTEQLLLADFVDKWRRVAPSAVWRVYGGTQGMGYEERKARAERFAAGYLDGWAEYGALSRRHDVADALCVVSAWLGKAVELRRVEERQAQCLERTETFGKFIEQFACGIRST